MRSILLLTAMMFLLVALVFAGGIYFGLSGPVIAVIAAIVVVFSTFMSWYQSDRLVIAMTRARPADPVQYARLHNVVEEIAIAAGLPKPKVYIVDDPAPNAFATGRDPEHGVVAFTTGILQEMNRAELEGVTAHELAHIRNRDTLVSAIAAATAGALAIISDLMFRMMIFGGGRGRRNSNNAAGAFGLIAVLVGAILAPIAAVLLQAAISRKREALADATSVEFTRNPSGLRSALEKLAQDNTVVKARASSVAHVWIESPLDESSMSKLFATHPPLSDRIAALKRLEGMA
jgi:heat shock protein HtpX